MRAAIGRLDAELVRNLAERAECVAAAQSISGELRGREAARRPPPDSRVRANPVARLSPHPTSTALTVTCDHFLRPVLPLLLCSALAACASGNVERAYVAPTGRTVTSELEAAYGGQGQHVIVLNSSTVEIVVTSVTLSDCENVKTTCEVHRLRVPVGPGQHKQVFTIRTGDGNEGHNFRYAFSWEAKNASPTLTGQ